MHRTVAFAVITGIIAGCLATVMFILAAIFPAPATAVAAIVTAAATVVLAVVGLRDQHYRKLHKPPRRRLLVYETDKD